MQLETVITRQVEDKTDCFFGPATKETFQTQIETSVDHILNFLSRENVHSGMSPEYLHHLQQSIQKEIYSSQSLERTLDQLKLLFTDNTVAYHHPNYLSHLNCPIVLPAIAGDLIATSLNTAIETWDQSTSGTLIEQEIIDWITDRVGMKKGSDGIFTSGGTQSNFMGLLLARDHYAYENYDVNIKENGFDDNVKKYRIFCSEKSHFSIQKNAALLGLGYESVVCVPTDDKMRMDTEKLSKLLIQSLEKGEVPIAVVATMGTTDFGSFDPLSEIASITKRFGLWLHTDCAYGGCFSITETHKHQFEAMKYADSATIDFHKSFYQPVCSSVFLVSNKEHFKYVSHHADYLNPIENKNEEMPDLIEKSIQTTRRFDALKLWVTLKTLGEKKMISLLEEVCVLTRETYQRMKSDDRIEFLQEPALTTLVFRYKTPNVSSDNIHDKVNKYIKQKLFESGKLSVASTRHSNTLYLKFTLLDPQMSIDHMVNAFETIKNMGNAYQYNN